MRHVILLLFCVVALGAGCASPVTPIADEEQTDQTTSDLKNEETGETEEEAAEALESDFTPPTGRAKGPGNLGPWLNRLVFASSTDGQAFTSTEQVLSDQADVPDLAIDEDGRLYLYYVAWTAGERDNQLVVAISDDQGDSWVFKYVDIDGLARTGRRGPQPVDPDIQILDDGTFRLYFTYDAKTYYAESENGITFTYKGIAFQQSGKQVLDPNTILIGDTWHLFAGGGPGGNWHAISSDGETFTFVGTEPFESTDGRFYMMANGIPVDGGYRYWGFSNQGTDIHSFFTTDGQTWEPEGLSLAYSADREVEEGHVKDSSVIELPDGSFFMVYVTQVP